MDKKHVTSSAHGAATRINKHLLLIGAIRRLVLFAQRIIRMLDMYFSMVLRRAAWASRDSESASLMTTTEKRMRSADQRTKPSSSTNTTFETLFRAQIDLLCLCNLFKNLLNNHSIVTSSFTRIYSALHWYMYHMKTYLGVISMW